MSNLLPAFLNITNDKTSVEPKPTSKSTDSNQFADQMRRAHEETRHSSKQKSAIPEHQAQRKQVPDQPNKPDPMESDKNNLDLKSPAPKTNQATKMPGIETPDQMDALSMSSLQTELSNTIEALQYVLTEVLENIDPTEDTSLSVRIKVLLDQLQALTQNENNLFGNDANLVEIEVENPEFVLTNLPMNQITALADALKALDSNAKITSYSGSPTLTQLNNTLNSLSQLLAKHTDNASSSNNANTLSVPTTSAFNDNRIKSALVDETGITTLAAPKNISELSGLSNQSNPSKNLLENLIQLTQQQNQFKDSTIDTAKLVRNLRDKSATESTALPAMAQNPLQNVSAVVNKPAFMVATPFQTPQWGQAIAEQITWMANKGIQSAEIQMDPPELGPIQVKVTVNSNEQANVSFVVQHSSVREALDQSAMRLRELFSGEGLNLVDVDVSDQSQHGQNEFEEQDSEEVSEMALTREEHKQEDPEHEISQMAINLVNTFV